MTAIAQHELKKIIHTPALGGLILLALLMNIVIVSTIRSDYANFIASASHETGIQLGSDFDSRASHLEPCRNTDIFISQTQNKQDVLYGYTTCYIAELAINYLDLTGLPARLMREKYRRFQYAVDARFEAGDSMNLYFADVTVDRHMILFRYVIGVLLFQGIILAALITFLSLGYDNHAKTEGVVYATKAGRRVTRAKLIASLGASLTVYIFIAAITLGVYLYFNPMGGVWGSSVSSGFNIMPDIFPTGRPFVTWFSFTVLTYLLAVIGVSIAIVLSFVLMAYTIGLRVQNGYIGLLITFIVNAIIVIIPLLSRWRMLNFTLLLSPVSLSMQQIRMGTWFTDGSSNTVLPYFETIGIIGYTAILALLGVWASLRFKRRDIL